MDDQPKTEPTKEQAVTLQYLGNPDSEFGGNALGFEWLKRSGEKTVVFPNRMTADHVLNGNGKIWRLEGAKSEAADRAVELPTPSVQKPDLKNRPLIDTKE
jgi:hypothetical protein